MGFPSLRALIKDPHHRLESDSEEIAYTHPEFYLQLQAKFWLKAPVYLWSQVQHLHPEILAYEHGSLIRAKIFKIFITDTMPIKIL